MAPRGTNLSLEDLLLALRWKLESGDDGETAYEIEDFADAQRKIWVATWSQRIDASKHIMSLFQHRLNALPVVNRLPFEILGVIFLDLQKIYRNTSFDLPRSAHNLKDANSWIKITHVCRRWRRAAHNTKALWSRITLNESLKRPAYLATSFFSLSYPLPITLEHQLGPLSQSEEEQMNRFYRSLVENPNRIAALYLRGHFPDVAWSLLQTAMPNIVDIDLLFEVIDRNLRTNEITPARNGKIENFLGGYSPSLRRISLENYVWPRQNFPALTHLYLTYEFEDWVDAKEFYSILKAVSLTLQVLFLSGATPSADSAETFNICPRADRISMPVLRHFEAYPSADTFPLLLLQNLSMSNIATVIWGWQISLSLDEYTPSQEGMSLMPPAEHLIQVRHLVSWAYQTDTYVLRKKTLYADPGRVNIYSLVGWWKHLPYVTTLALRGEDLWRHNELEHVHEALKECTTLKSLHLDSHFTLFLSSILPYFETEHEDDSDFCPHLETVTFYTGKASMWAVRNCSEEFYERDLQPLNISANNSTTRARPHLQSSYVLWFKAGDIDQFTFED